MRYFLTLLPPLAILTIGFKPFTLILNIILTVCFYIPGVIHALLMVNKYYADSRHKEMLDAMAAQSGVRNGKVV
tara:strand:+ start:168 stop:389 length:222 start_codon:yes stop_codon:yes gene_type:complete